MIHPRFSIEVICTGFMCQTSFAGSENGFVSLPLGCRREPNPRLCRRLMGDRSRGSDLRLIDINARLT
jgi:hypothetical protein